MPDRHAPRAQAGSTHDRNHITQCTAGPPPRAEPDRSQGRRRRGRPGPVLRPRSDHLPDRLHHPHRARRLRAPRLRRRLADPSRGGEGRVDRSGGAADPSGAAVGRHRPRAAGARRPDPGRQQRPLAERRPRLGRARSRRRDHPLASAASRTRATPYPARLPRRARAGARRRRERGRRGDRHRPGDGLTGMPVPRLVRSADDRLIAGVCGGIAAALSLDANLVRFVFALLALAGGAGILLYLAIWAWTSERSRLAPVLLLFAGVALLRGIGLRWTAVVAIAMIGVGLAMIWRRGGLRPGAAVPPVGVGLAMAGGVVLLTGGGTSVGFASPGAVAAALLLILGP